MLKLIIAATPATAIKRRLLNPAKICNGRQDGRLEPRSLDRTGGGDFLLFAEARSDAGDSATTSTDVSLAGMAADGVEIAGDPADAITLVQMIEKLCPLAPMFARSSDRPKQTSIVTTDRRYHRAMECLA